MEESSSPPEIQGLESLHSVVDVGTTTNDAQGIKVVRTSPLTHYDVFVENFCPVKCLPDSGCEFPVAKRSVVDKIIPQVHSVGQIKLQGMFGEPV